MNRFITPLDTRLIGEQKFMLIAPLEYENKQIKITIYQSFEFDGASIPESLWTIIGCPFGGLYTKASCLHDALYASHVFDKKTSDKLFHEAMIASGVKEQTAKQMYLAVRAFGDQAYNEKYEIQKNRNLIEVEIK